MAFKTIVVFAFLASSWGKPVEESPRTFQEFESNYISVPTSSPYSHPTPYPLETNPPAIYFTPHFPPLLNTVDILDPPPQPQYSTFVTEPPSKLYSKEATNSPLNQYSTDITNLQPNQYSTDTTNLSPNQYSTDTTNLPSHEYSNDVTNPPSKQYSTDTTNLQPNQYSEDDTNLPLKQYSTDTTNLQPNQYSKDDTNPPSNQYSTDTTNLPSNQYSEDDTNPPSNQYSSDTTNLPSNQYSPETETPSSANSKPTSIHKVKTQPPSNTLAPNSLRPGTLFVAIIPTSRFPPPRLPLGRPFLGFAAQRFPFMAQRFPLLFRRQLFRPYTAPSGYLVKTSNQISPPHSPNIPIAISFTPNGIPSGYAPFTLNTNSNALQLQQYTYANIAPQIVAPIIMEPIHLDLNRTTPFEYKDECRPNCLRTRSILPFNLNLRVGCYPIRICTRLILIHAREPIRNANLARAGIRAAGHARNRPGQLVVKRTAG